MVIFRNGELLKLGISKYVQLCYIKIGWVNVEFI